MTASDVLFDTWAWWEVLRGTPTGLRLRKRYIRGGGPRIHTSALTLGEVAAKLVAEGHPEAVPNAVASIQGSSRLHDVTPDIAVEGGHLRAEMRKGVASASLVDAVILATARRIGARIVTADPAFRGFHGVTRW